MTAVDLELLAELALAEAERHPPRSPGRRAASHLWHSLTRPPVKTITAARNAIASYGTEATQADALALLAKLVSLANGSDQTSGKSSGLHH